MKYLRLSDLLVNSRVITNEQLKKALAMQKDSGKRLGTVLIENKIITESQLIETLKIQLGIEYIDLNTITITSEMAKVLPKSIAKKHMVVPIRVIRDEIFLAMGDPLNFVALEEVAAATHKKVVPLMASSAALERAVANLYSNEGAARAIEEMRKDNYVTDLDQPIDMVAYVDDDTNSAPTIRLVNSIIDRAVTENASDIHLEPRESELVVRMRIDGILHVVLNVPKELQSSVISRFKVMANMDISQRRIPQDGRSNVRIRGQEIDLRVSTLPTIYGEKVVLRLLRKSQTMLSMEGIGLRGHNLEVFEKVIANNAEGVVLIVGPTGSGKSSTMYTIIRNLNKEEVNLVTLEDPVEYNIDGINQVQINEKAGLTFANTLRSILRQDPDIIGVGEIRDAETADIALRAALTGHLVISTIHTNDAKSSVDRLLGMGVEPYLVADSVKGIVSQRLVRRICPNCRKPYKPDHGEISMMKLPTDREYKFYKGAGCAECFYSGYRGRIGVFEILTFNNEMRHAVAENNMRLLEEELAKSDFQPIIMNCQELVLDGTTSVAEINRAISTGV